MVRTFMASAKVEIERVDVSDRHSNVCMSILSHGKTLSHGDRSVWGSSG